MHIANNSTGHSYEKIFSHFLDEMLTEVHVEDPYIRQGHQIYNFLRFCELLVGSTKCSVKRIHLTTGEDEVRILLGLHQDFKDTFKLAYCLLIP